MILVRDRVFAGTPPAGKRRGVSAAAKANVMAQLAAHMNGGAECYPSQDLLAAESGMSRGQVNRTMAALELDGVIVRQARYGPDGERDSDLVTLQVEAIEALPRAADVAEATMRAERAQSMRAQRARSVHLGSAQNETDSVRLPAAPSAPPAAPGSSSSPSEQEQPQPQGQDNPSPTRAAASDLADSRDGSAAGPDTGEHDGDADPGRLEGWAAAVERWVPAGHSFAPWVDALGDAAAQRWPEYSDARTSALAALAVVLEVWCDDFGERDHVNEHFPGAVDRAIDKVNAGNGTVPSIIGLMLSDYFGSKLRIAGDRRRRDYVLADEIHGNVEPTLGAVFGWRSHRRWEAQA